MEPEFIKEDLVKSFQVEHKDGDCRYACAENERGFLTINHFAPFIGNWTHCILKKPQWSRKE